MTIRIVFMGSPDFSLPILQAIAQFYQVVGVVTQPDRPAGRGRTLTPPPIKSLALELGLPFIQPRRVRDLESMQQIQRWQPDLIVVAAFGQILRQELLDLPAFGCVNVHASLLPRWRGAAPIQAAILHGDSQTGITIMRMDVGIDTGDILSQKSESILPTDTTATLSQRLSALGANLLIDTLPMYLDGQLVPQKQPGDGATYAPMLNKEDGRLDFNQPALRLVNQVRAFNPWPGAFTLFNNQILKILTCSVVPKDEQIEIKLTPGQRTLIHRKPAIMTVDGLLVLDIVHPAGKKPMPGQVFLQGARGWD